MQSQKLQIAHNFQNLCANLSHNPLVSSLVQLSDTEDRVHVCERDIQSKELHIHELEQHRRCMQIEMEQKKAYNKQLEQVYNLMLVFYQKLLLDWLHITCGESCFMRQSTLLTLSLTDEHHCDFYQF